MVPELHKALRDSGELRLSTGTLNDVNNTLQRLRDMPVALTGWGLCLLNKNFILTVSQRET